jgi:phytoene dehydrogenase-like protein
MKHFDVVVLGAGPSGLTAAHFLALAGARVAVVERQPQSGGLMRGFVRGAYALDLGRKELYSRHPEIHALWTSILGDDFRPYAHEVGLFSDGGIMEKKSRKALLALSPAQQARLAASFLWAQVRPGSRLATNIEDYYTLRFGRVFYDFFEHGFKRKFHGTSLRDVPLEQGDVLVRRFSALREGALGQAAEPALHMGQHEWRHPARGTQQIVTALEAGARARGVEFFLGCRAEAVTVVDGRARGVRVRSPDGELDLHADSVIAGIPLRTLVKLLGPLLPGALATPPVNEVAFRKSTALVYLMADEPPRFRHNWLEVNDLSYRVGRIVNYATWNTDMVPAGHTALCMEYFCMDGDGLMEQSEAQLRELAIAEAKRAGLLDVGRIVDTFVHRMPRVNAATKWLDWRVHWMAEVKDFLASIPNLHEVNRPGMDRASLAGKDAAIACCEGRPMSTRSLDDTPVTQLDAPWRYARRIAEAAG